jgi:hypothetical protein
MKQSRKSDRLRRLFSGTIALLTVSTSFVPYTERAEANPALAAPLSACMTNPYCAIAVVTVGGLAYWELNQNGQKKWIPLAPIIDDPDQPYSEEFDYIWADSESEAIRKCRALTEGWKVQYVRVKQVGRGKRYECYWRS